MRNLSQEKEHEQRVVHFLDNNVDTGDGHVGGPVCRYGHKDWGKTIGDSGSQLIGLCLDGFQWIRGYSQEQMNELLDEDGELLEA